MVLENLLANYGYIALFFGAFVEGEATLLIGSYLAYLGYLELPAVMFFACLGGYAGDQAIYWFGRWRGFAWLPKHPRWQKKTERVFQGLHDHQIKVIILSRFIYGVRSVVPFAAGLSGMPPRRFMLLNAAGVLIWAVTMSSLGYLLGPAVDTLIHFLKHLETGILILLAALVLTAVGYYLYRKHLALQPHR